MPELPEVETMCRCIAAAVGCRIDDVERPRSRLQSISISPRLDHFRRRAVGRQIAAIRRVGKRVVLELDGGGDCIVLEPRMTGLVLLDDPPDRKHLRLVLRLRCEEMGTGSSHDARPAPSSRRRSEPVPISSVRARQILFWDQRGLGVARLLTSEQFSLEYGLDRLGPDALTVSPQMLRARLGGSRRPIKVALLDQRAVAGIGNLYASEILHRAGIHPAVPCSRLRPGQWSKIHAAIGVVLQAAIRHQGSTLRDGTYRIARNKPGDYQVCHRVYQRAGEACLKCGRGSVVRIVQAQRSTFFCPACQRPCGSSRTG